MGFLSLLFYIFFTGLSIFIGSIPYRKRDTLATKLNIGEILLPDETLIKEGRGSERELFDTVFFCCCLYVFITFSTFRGMSNGLAEVIMSPKTTRVVNSPDEAIKLFIVYFGCTFGLFFYIRQAIKDFLGNVIVLTDKRMIGIGNRCTAKSTDRNLFGSGRGSGSGSSIDVPLDKIDNVLVHTNAITVKRGSGNIIIGSGSQSFTFNCFQEPEGFKTLIMAQVDQKQKEASQMQIEQQEKLAQEQKVEAERLMLLQAEAMAKAMVEAQKQTPPNQ